MSSPEWRMPGEFEPQQAHAVNRARLDAAADVIARARTADGEPFRVVRMPVR